jgi:hypothetical protein
MTKEISAILRCSLIESADGRVGLTTTSLDVAVQFLLAHQRVRIRKVPK